MSWNYDKAIRPLHQPFERVEVNFNNGQALKKYNATGQSWPEYSAVQYQGISHLGNGGKTPYGYTHPNADLNLYGQGLNNLFDN